MPPTAARKSTAGSTFPIIVSVVSLGAVLGLLAGLAMKAAERFPRQETVAAPHAVSGRLPADQDGPVQPGPMSLQLFCERCPPPAPTNL